MDSGQIDKLCQDWLRENYGEEIASEYAKYSLMSQGQNSTELNDALNDLLYRLSLAFGADESFGSANYLEARKKLELPDDRSPVPYVFIEAFITN
jgi:hypothetical protein